MLTALKKGQDINLSSKTNPIFLNKLREKFNQDSEMNNQQISRQFEKDRRVRSKDINRKLMHAHFSQKILSNIKNREISNKRKRFINPKQSLMHQSQLINQINRRKVNSRFKD